jgi:hypothetical protein
MVIMAEYGITEILTEDDHFLQVGMRFQKVPYLYPLRRGVRSCSSFRPH